MYGENEYVNDNHSKLDKKTKTKYNSPIYNFIISFIIHIYYLLIFLVFIYSIIIYNNQIFNSGIFDNIISDGGGYCSPFIERSSSNDNLETSTSKNEYSNISLFNLIKFDYIDTNINNNCNPENSKKDIDISFETGEHTYGYGLVSFNKKYIDYLYYFFNNKYINLSNLICYIKYNNNSYAYNDNLISYSLRNWWLLNIVWVFIDLVIALPIMFSIDTIRKSLVYNILIYNLIYKSLYNYINEGLILLIFGLLFVYYQTLCFSLLILFPCFITGITFFIVFIYNLFFQTYHYIMYSIEIFKKLMEKTNDSKKPISTAIKYGPLYIIRLLGTFLKIIIVFFMMFNVYTCFSPFILIFFIIYTLIFLYIIMPGWFKGNTLNTSKTSKTSKNILKDLKENTSIDTSNYVNIEENYSLISVWKGISYKQRYIYLLLVIIFLIDFVGSDIIDKFYSYLVALVVFLIILFLGYFFNLLTCYPDQSETIQTGGGNFFTDFLLNRINKVSFKKNKFYIEYIDYFSKENPLSILNRYKLHFNKKTCNKTIDSMSIVTQFEVMFNKIFPNNTPSTAPSTPSTAPSTPPSTPSTAPLSPHSPSTDSQPTKN